MSGRAPGAPIDVVRGTLHGRARSAVRVVLLALARLLLGLRIEGLEHVPRQGAALVAANHLHNADPILIAAAYPRLLLFMAKKELFANRLLSRLLWFAGAFPVDRGKADRGAIRYAETALAQGEPVAMFPEGTRSMTGQLGSGQPGAGLLALRGAVPVLPVAITGTEVLPGNGKKGRRGPRGRPRVTIRFGAPIDVASRPGEPRISSQQATDRIMVAISALLPPEHRP